MLKLKTVSMIAKPGNIANHHLLATKVSRLSASILPQVGTSGGTPSPRKESAASERITLATLKEAITVNGASMFGRIVRKIIESVLSPIALAASTNSFSRNERVSALTIRAYVTHCPIPRTRIRFQTPDPRTTRNIIARRMNGNASWMSPRRMIASSSHPPK